MSQPADTQEDNGFRIYQGADYFALRRPKLGQLAHVAPAAVARIEATAPAVDADVAPAHGTDVEQQLLAALTAPARPNETIDAAYKRKELEVGTIFARLSAPESRALARRLQARAVEDRLAAEFLRLNETRRARLLAFLNDAKRREALALELR